LNEFWLLPVELFSNKVNLFGLPFSIDVLLFSLPFFILGFLLKNNILNMRLNLLLVTVSMIGFVLISLFTDAHLDLNRRHVIEPLFSVLGAFLGIYIVLFFSLLISKSEKMSYFPALFGSSSLFILIFHHFLLNYGAKVFNILLPEGMDIAIALLTLCLSVGFPIFIKKLASMNLFASFVFSIK
jgi:polysaccharide biosynthesis protein PslL